MKHGKWPQANNYQGGQEAPTRQQRRAADRSGKAKPIWRAERDARQATRKAT